MYLHYAFTAFHGTVMGFHARPCCSWHFHGARSRTFMAPSWVFMGLSWTCMVLSWCFRSALWRFHETFTELHCIFMVFLWGFHGLSKCFHEALVHRHSWAGWAYMGFLFTIMMIYGAFRVFLGCFDFALMVLWWSVHDAFIGRPWFPTMTFMSLSRCFKGLSKTCHGVYMDISRRFRGYLIIVFMVRSFYLDGAFIRISWFFHGAFVVFRELSWAFVEISCVFFVFFMMSSITFSWHTHQGSWGFQSIFKGFQFHGSSMELSWRRCVNVHGALVGFDGLWWDFHRLRRTFVGLRAVLPCLFHRLSWSFQGVAVEYKLEFHGAFMVLSCLHGLSWVFIGLSWSYIGFDEIFIDFDGFSRAFMVFS